MLQQYLKFLNSYIGYKTELKPFLKPLYLTFIVTRNCNLKCPFCYAWRTPHKDELNLEEIKNVFSSRTLRNLISIGITGGEPFIRSDIVDIALAILDRIPNLTDLRFVTNGCLSEKIVSSIQEILDVTHSHVSVKVSVDGMESKHDEFRGKGTFSKVIKTLEGLKELKKNYDDLSISIGFTAMDQNIDEIWDLYKRFGDEYEFFFKPAQSLPISEPLPISERTRQKLIEFTDYYLEKEFNNKRTSLWMSSRKLYYKYLLAFLKHQDVRPVPCSASYSFLTLDSDGTVRPCSVSSYKLGNVKDTPLDQIWYSSAASKIRRKIKRGECTCCTSCDLGPSILTCRWYAIVFNYLTGLYTHATHTN